MLYRVFRGYTRVHNIKPNHDLRFNDLVFRGLQDILKSFPDMKKLQKPKTLRVLCVVFWSLKKTRKSVCTLFTTVCIFFSCTPSNTQLTNHHTEVIQSYHFQTITPKSYQNHTILEIYIFLSASAFNQDIGSWDTKK